MNFSVIKPLAGIVLALSAGLANASVVTFDSAKGSFYDYSESSYGLIDLSIVPMVASGQALDTFGFIFGSTTLGKPFDLESLKLGNLPGTRKNGGTIDLFYTVAGSLAIHEETLTLDNSKGLELFSQTGSGSDQLLALDDLTSFSLVGKDFLDFQVDTITVTPYQAPTPAVPEPANAALLLSALALLGFVARRRSN